MDESIVTSVLEEGGTAQGLLIAVLRELKKDGATRTVISHCRRALEQDPGNVELRLLLAHAYLDSELLSRAGDELEQAARRLDEMAEAYLDLARVYERQGRKAEASTAVEVFLAHHPEDARGLELRESIGPAEEEGMALGPGETGEQLEDPGERDDFEEIATPTLAELYAKQGQIAAAVETYRRILAKDPENQRARQRLEELEAEERVEESDFQRTGELVAVLEQWLGRIREMRVQDVP